MATKYTREDDGADFLDGRRTPWMRQGPPRNTLTPRQRLFFLLMGLAVLGLLGKLAHDLNVNAPFVFQPVVRGTATVTAVAPGLAGADSRQITLEIPWKARTFTAERAIPGPFGAQLSVGDRLTVLYRVSETGTTLDLVESGLVALTDENR